MTQEYDVQITENELLDGTEGPNDALALLPIKNVVILPKSIIPVIVGRSGSIKAVEHALKSHKNLFVTAQKNPGIEHPTIHDVYDIGTRATILQVMRMPNKSLKILIEGVSRAKIIEEVVEENFIAVRYQDLPIHSEVLDPVELEAAWRQLRTLYTAYARFNERVPADLMELANSLEDKDCIVDTIAIHLNLSFSERQEILETINLKDRMLKIALLIKKEIEILETEQRIKGHIQTQVEKNQREYYLNEQMKAIQKELGREDQQAEINQLREEVSKLQLPQEAAEKVEKELRRLEQMPPLSAEAVVSRHYIDWIISLPWHIESTDTVSLTQAEKILDASHSGLSKAKERIIEFLAAKKFSGTTERATIICLVGPPGVGKTSLARAIADSLGRTFVRIALGGVRDEAEIRGHRRTYIGALPGKIIHAMKKAGTVNPVILLDEIDKMSHDLQGDPSSALLEVLDPEQNKSFSDHFLDVEYDLSKVMFIATANHIEGIPLPLYDRMEVISLAGYTEDEKLTIARTFLIPKKLKEYHLNTRQVKLSDEVLRKIISEYTKEAGVRQLERIIAKCMRKAIQRLLTDKTVKSVPVTLETIQDWLGYPKYRPTSLAPTQGDSGVATGLAWTEIGGDVLEIEASIVTGKGGVLLTGQLGDVMQESAQAALSYIRSRAAELGLKPSFTSTKDIHIHLPEGATPKDGPSAGITMCTALVSALTQNPVKASIAMTGEITLRGRVLAVGGLKEKLLAAKRYKMDTVIVPKENYSDIQEIKKDLGEGLTILFAENMDEVLVWALTKNPFVKKVVVKKKSPIKKSLKTATKNGKNKTSQS